MPQYRFEVVSKPHCQGDNCERGIGEADRGKNRTSGDEKVRHAVHTALRIHDSPFRILVYTRAAHVMMPTRGAFRPRLEIADAVLHPTREFSAQSRGDDRH